MSKLTAISPVDGRYQKQTATLSSYFSEFGLIKYRVLVEVHYFLFLADKKLFKVTPALRKSLLAVVKNFSEADAEKIKTIEATDLRKHFGDTIIYTRSARNTMSFLVNQCDYAPRDIFWQDLDGYGEAKVFKC